jgi:small-conductance mechanosensitive channel
LIPPTAASSNAMLAKQQPERRTMHTEKPARRRRFRGSIVAALGVLLSVTCSFVAADQAAENASERVATSQGLVELADVVVDGRLVMRVRGTASFPAARRAEEIEQKIIAAARDDRIATDDVTIQVEEDRTLLRAGDRPLLDLFDADAEVEQLNIDLLAESSQKRIQEIIAAYRDDRSPEVLLEKAAYGLAAVLLAAVLIVVFAKASRALAKLLDRRLQKQIKTLEQKSARLIRSRNLTTVLRALTKVVFLGLVALTLYVSTQFVLGLFPWTRELADWLFGLILHPLEDIGLGLLGVIPDLIRLAILFVITRYLLTTIRTFFRGVDNGSVKLASFDRDLALPTYRLVRLVVILFAIVMAYPYIPGSDSAAFKGLSVLAGLIISLGSQSVIGNIIAGYSLLYRRPFKIGDRIKLGDTVGIVTELRVLTTRLRSLKNEEIVIPNTTVLNGEVVNYSTLAREQGLILHTTVGIGYETPWRQVEAMLKEAAARTSGLLDKPKPFVLQKALGDFAVTYEINAFCNDPKNMAHIYSALHRNILDVFNEYGVAIMTPNYVADPPEPKLVPQDAHSAPL